MTNIFIGRKEEIKELDKLFKKNAASLVVVQGRRRIGKTRLVEEFGKKYRFYSFSGIPPTAATTKETELDEFARQLSMQTGLPEFKMDDWSKFFFMLADCAKKGKVVILFDEISWMGSKDPDFLGKLKNAWDMYFKKNSKLILILCGSVSVWIEENILSSTGFVGRISLRLTLDELPLVDCNKFWQQNISAYEKLKILAVTGGIPRYLEEIKPSLSAEENIKDLCFVRGGPLVNEFNDIFNDLFFRRSATYKKIIQVLADTPLELKDICEKLGIERTGFISEYLDNLLKSGFLTRDYSWNIKSGALSKLSHYRLSDNYLRFYLKYVDKNLPKIVNNDYAYKSLAALPNFDAIIGLQFENLVLKNRRAIKKLLGILPDEVVTDNPYFQRKTKRHNGCQIDYLIQTRSNNLYACEIKFSKKQIASSIISEMQNKIRSLHIPKGYSCRAVLIHVNGVSDEVMDSNYFSHIIDFGELLVSE